MIDTEYSEILLEKMRFLARCLVSEEFLRTTQFAVSADYMTRGLIAGVTKEVLSHRVLADEAEVDVVGWVRCEDVRSVMVEIPNGWMRRLLRRRTRKVWAHVIGDATVIDPDAEEIRVVGKATVRAEYFRTFPEPTFTYPPELGTVRMLVRTGDPYGWDPKPWL